MPTDFGVRLKGLREKRGWTTYELAEKIGFSQAYVSLLETGIRRPSTEVMIQVSKVFGMKVPALLKDVEL